MLTAMFTPQPLFIFGPMEIIIIGLVAAVIIFGSRAPDIARTAGQSFGEFQKSRQEVEKELEPVREEVQEVRDDINIDEDIQEIREDVNNVRRDVEQVTKPPQESANADPDRDGPSPAEN